MPGLHWNTKEQKALANQLIKQHKEIDDVQIAGRTQHAIRSQARRLELIEGRPGRYKWPAKQRKLLRKYKKDGLLPREIYDFDLLGPPRRSLWAITKQWGRMKLSDRKRAKSMRGKKVWRLGERRKFDQFLRAHSKKMTPEEIGKQWDVARSTVARRQTELGIKVPRDQVLQMAYSQAKQQRSRRKLRRENIANWARRRELREKQLLQLATKLTESTRKPPVQTCTDCQRSWPKRREFFHTSEKKISIGTSRYFKRRCVLCENARRREIERQRRTRS